MTDISPYLLPPQYYHATYLLAVTLLTVWLMREYAGEGERLRYRADARRQAWQIGVTVAVLSLFLGFRPLTADFGDSMAYVGIYEAIAHGLMSEDDYLLSEILFNPHTSGQLDNIMAKLSELKSIIDSRNSAEMKKFLDRVRDNLR